MGLCFVGGLGFGFGGVWFGFVVVEGWWLLLWGFVVFVVWGVALHISMLFVLLMLCLFGWFLFWWVGLC